MLQICNFVSKFKTFLGGCLKKKSDIFSSDNTI